MCADGTPVMSDIWASGEPTTDQGKNCAAISKNDRLAAVNCSQEYYSVCEISLLPGKSLNLTYIFDVNL